MGEVTSLTIPGNWFVNPRVLGESVLIVYRKYKDYPIEEIRKLLSNRD